MDAIRFHRLADWLALGPVVLASVWQTRGAVPRHAGAQMLVCAGDTFDTVGGGRLEARVIATARLLLQSESTDTTLDIDLSGAAGADGLCGGKAWISLRRLHRPEHRAWAHHVADRLDAGERVLLDAESLGVRDATATLELRPAPRWLIFGAGHCGQALYRAAAPMGFDCHVFDTRPEGYSANGFIGATCHQTLHPLPPLLDYRSVSAFLLNRDWQSDVAALRLLVAQPPDFLGLMGSRRRIAAVRAEVPEMQHLGGRLHAPIGLDIEAETPAEIAVAILAEWIRWNRRLGAASAAAAT